MKWKSQFFENKKVVVYGATGGLGKALCHVLRSQLNQLVLAGRNQDKLIELQSELEASAVEVWQVDVEKISEFAARIRESEVDGLIIATGQNSYGAFSPPAGEGEGNSNILWAKYKELLTVNMESVFHLFMELLPYFQQRQGFFHIVGSYASIFPVPYQAIYAASKASLFSFVLSVGREMQHSSKKSKGLPSISLIGGMRTRMYYQSGLHEQFSEVENYVTSSPEKIAMGIISGIAKRKQIITPGFSGFFLYHVARRLPLSLLSRFFHKIYLPRKKNSAAFPD